MPSIRRIVAPIDLSVQPEFPVKHAIRVADAMGAELTLLHAGNSRDVGGVQRPPWPDNALCGETRSIQRVAVPGLPARMITRYADYLDADMVLMVRSDTPAWSRFWRRSVTDKVLRSTSKPVYVVNRSAVVNDPGFRCRTVLCLLHMDGSDGPALRQAESLVEAFGGQLILLGIVPNTAGRLLTAPPAGPERPMPLGLALERLRSIGKELTVPYKTSVMFGSPQRCLTLAAREHAADLVVAVRSTGENPLHQSVDVQPLQRGLSCAVLSVAATVPATAPVQPGTSEPAHAVADVPRF